MNRTVLGALGLAFVLVVLAFGAAFFASEGVARARVAYVALAVAVITLVAALYLVVLRDFRGRRSAEAELARREALLRAITECTTDAVFAKDLSGRYLWINTAGAAFLGVRPEEAIGRTDAEFFDEAGTASTRMRDSEAMAASRPITYEDASASAGTMRHYLSTKGPLLDSEGGVVGVVGVARDITARRAAEEALRLANERLSAQTTELAAANAEMEAFTYTVSHDLRAPLRHVSGFVELLEKHSAASLDDEGRRLLGRISAAATRMGLLIDDLLVFSRMGRTELRQKPVALEPLVRDVVREVSQESNGRPIEWALGVLPNVTGDPAMLRVVLVNLLGNAVKYTRRRERARIGVEARTDDSGATVVTVRDDGVGFDMAYVDKLFGVFQRLHRAEDFEGTGIGLATVRRIVEKHGGTVGCEGRPGEGATFWFTLPGRPTETTP